MKRLLGLILAACLMLSAFSVCAADIDYVTVYVNGELVQSDVGAVIENGVIMLPFRAVFEKMGYTVLCRKNMYVSAQRGLTKVYAYIESDMAYVYGEQVMLEVPVRIVNGRTLISAKVFSEVWGEALNAGYVWDEDTKTVYITESETRLDHAVGYDGDVKVIKSDDGADLIYFSSSYPIISNEDGNAVIDTINAKIKEDCAEYYSEIDEYVEDAEAWYKEAKEYYRYEEFAVAFDIDRDKDGILSLTRYDYYDFGGAHPNSTTSTRVFDLENGKVLELGDILNGTDKEIEEMIYNKFFEYFMGEGMDAEAFATFTAPLLKEEVDNVSFCITDDSLVLYFQPYQVAPYAAGYPTVVIPFEGNKELFKEERLFNGT